MKKIRQNELKMLRPKFGKQIGCSPRMVQYYEEGMADIPRKIANSVLWIRHLSRLGKLDIN
ncbi:MAG: hypothetical protein V4721_00620 [Bacteroidota bacterium]